MSSEQANADRERELRERDARERELMEQQLLQQHAAQQEENIKREADQRDREFQERQQREQAAHQAHNGPMQIHQPVAVAPSTRTIHGPNGLLGQSAPHSAPMTGANAAGPMYGSASGQHDQNAQRMQHAVQQPPPQPQMLMPFAGPQGAIGMGQPGQQPILNVRLRLRAVIS